MADASVEVMQAAAGDTSRVAILNGGGGRRRKKSKCGGGSARTGKGKKEKEGRCGWQLGRSLLALLVCLLLVETTALVLLLVQRLSSKSAVVTVATEDEAYDKSRNRPDSSEWELNRSSPPISHDWEGTNSSRPTWDGTNSSSPPAWEMTNGSNPDGWPMLLQPRCFSMCESADLFYRQGVFFSVGAKFSQHRVHRF